MRHRKPGMLGHEASVTKLNCELCDQIWNGDIELFDPALTGHLNKSSIEELGVYNPRYSAHRQAMEKAN